MGTLTRWAKSYRSIKAQNKSFAAPDGNIIPALNPANWVTAEESKHKQRQYAPSRKAVMEADELFVVGKRTSFPYTETELKVCIAVEVHCRKSGYRAFAATIDIISKHYWWIEMKQKGQEFTQIFIHCIASRNGERFLRSLGSVSHGEMPSNVEHLDIPYMEPAKESGLENVLIVKDYNISYM